MDFDKIKAVRILSTLIRYINDASVEDDKYLEKILIITYVKIPFKDLSISKRLWEITAKADNECQTLSLEK